MKPQLTATLKKKKTQQTTYIVLGSAGYDVFEFDFWHFGIPATSVFNPIIYLSLSVPTGRCCDCFNLARKHKRSAFRSDTK